MKKRILALVALVACVAMLFTACGGAIDAAVYMTPESSKAYTTNGSKKIDGLDGYDNLVKVNDTYVKFIDYEVKEDVVIKDTSERVTSVKEQTFTNYKLYNLVTGEFKGEIPSNETTETTYYSYTGESLTPSSTKTSGNKTNVSVGGGENYILVTISKSAKSENAQGYSSNGTTKIVYDINMTEVARASYNGTASSGEFSTIDFDSDGKVEGFILDETLYKASGDTFVKSDRELDTIPFGWTGAEYYGGYLHFPVDLGSTVKMLTYKWEDFSLVNSWLIPSYYDNEDSVTVFFDNGNYLYQAVVIENDFADIYDFMDENGDKYSLETKLVDIESGKVEDIECNYIIDGKTGPDDFISLSKSEYEEYEIVVDDEYDALTWSSAVIDENNKRLTAVETIALGVNDNGKIVEIAPAIENQNCGKQGLSYKLANGSFIVNDVVGMAHLYNEDGELVKSIKAGYVVNDKFYRVGDKVYDINTFNKIFEPDKESETNETVYVLPDAVIVAITTIGADAGTTWTRYTANSSNDIATKNASDDVNKYTSIGTYTECEVYGGYYLVKTWKTTENSDGVKSTAYSVAAFNGEGVELMEVENIETCTILTNLKDVAIAVIEKEVIVKAATESTPAETEIQTSFYRLSK